MLAVNDTSFVHGYFDARFVEFERLLHLKRNAGQRYAVCMTEPERLLALCFYLRAAGASVAPLHPNTPLAAAQRLAKRMSCSQLLFHDEAISIVCDRDAHDRTGVLVQLSSGSSGQPQCSERTWASVDEEVASYVAALGELGSKVPLLACPVTHSYGLISGVLSSLSRGVAPVVLTNINPKYVIRRASAANALLYASPTLLHVLVRLLTQDASLCAVMTSGAPLRGAGFRELQQRSERILQQYGCSELGCISLNNDTQAACEVGTPLRHLEVTAGDRPECPQEIRVRLAEDVVSTKDVGYFNERGLCFVARVDDTINVAGINVYPGEVEDVILEFPGVEEAVVFKRSDPYAGERVCLKFTAAASLDEGELRRYCAGQLTPFAVPLEIQQVDHIPKLENGKINRRSLVDATSEPQS